MKAIHDYRPAPFWFLNHELQEDELQRQIALMRESHVSGFFIHARAGLKTPYGSAAWLAKVRFIAEQARANGLKAWLYDEDPFPSGMAGGRIILDHPEYAARTIRQYRLQPDSAGRIRSPLGQGILLSAWAVVQEANGDIVRQTDVKDAVGVIRPMYFKSSWNSSYYADWIQDVPYAHERAETFFPELYLDIDLSPDQTGTVVCVSVAEIMPTGSKFGFAPDNLNPACVRAFLDYTHERYRQTVADYFGDTIPGIFTDEPAAGGVLPWTPDLERIFAREHGYAIEANYHHLGANLGQGSRKIRQDYWQTINNLFISSYFAQVASWCQTQHLQLVGHVACEEDPVGQITTGGNAFAYQKFLNIPGFDIIGPNIGNRQRPGLLLGGKLIVSSARQNGCKKVLSECFACNDFNFGWAEMKKQADWLFALGINWLVPHGFYYSIDGYRKSDAGKSFFFQDRGFPRFKEFADYAARIGSILGEADSLAAICLVYPIRLFWQLHLAEPELETSLRDQLYRTVGYLIQQHIEFDLIDEQNLEHSSLANQRVTRGNIEYAAVILLDVSSISKDYDRYFERLLDEQGIPVIRANPDGTLSCVDQAAGWLNQTRILSDDRTDQRNLMLLKKRREKEIIYFLFNNASQPVEFTLQCESTHPFAYAYQADTDSYAALPRSNDLILLRLQGFASLLLVCGSQARETAGRHSSTESSASQAALETCAAGQWDYLPPTNLLHVIKTWDITIVGLDKTVRYFDQPFCLLRDCLGTKLDYLPYREKRPVFDQAPLLPDDYPVQATFCAHFDWPVHQEDARQDNSSGDCATHAVGLLFEGETFQGDYQLSINGKVIQPGQIKPHFIYDFENRLLDVSGDLIAGTNELRICWPKAGEFDGLKSLIYLISNE